MLNRWRASAASEVTPAMTFLIHETLMTLNTDDVFEFGLTEILRSPEQDDLFEAQAIFIRNATVTSKLKLTHLSEFSVVLSFITYIGNKLRGIAKDELLEFDLNGLTFDQYIPLSKNLRKIWGE
ncbi:hypothetical protein ACYG9R_11010 [Mesorhizobium sp. RSR565B]|uniref:hypothetical protein n=1 Tax=Mesorhizobium sp. L103C565B0 TaxID=1287094 RepID=UPI0003CFD05D|nr:hypothetical protein [Mesorhizobium sp. L103C565B0]ESZ51006.1 hypothetical protein X730_13885 [Mesorhizobium sp. L103C565B0]